ncbi:hypothetical protein JDV02_008409 [Purpureocillium takamizusanense]|uniref:Uncharacterized protein n=1 Tax=Purpureocillium takamizusanense TaxID=2060973 RepID=A0A9Q8QM11_9HYPO|nr:uncharacterized protein JDV02_008409 [Purpureocillium takamizusanense]UNI22528.1 hypothetical protein JDV02_008409 [Purpureocillium takamizusanense]
MFVTEMFRLQILFVAPHGPGQSPDPRRRRVRRPSTSGSRDPPRFAFALGGNRGEVSSIPETDASDVGEGERECTKRNEVRRMATLDASPRPELMLIYQTTLRVCWRALCRGNIQLGRHDLAHGSVKY